MTPSKKDLCVLIIQKVLLLSMRSSMQFLM